MNTKEKLQLVTFEQAKRLKALGFDWGIYHCYDIDGELGGGGVCNKNTVRGEYELFSAPTVALALKWMRDEKGFFGYVSYSPAWNQYDYQGFMWHIDSEIKCKCEQANLYELTDTYEEAEHTLLDEILTLLEEEQ
jgi:hypothetical protein